MSEPKRNNYGINFLTLGEAKDVAARFPFDDVFPPVEGPMRSQRTQFVADTIAVILTDHDSSLSVWPPIIPIDVMTERPDYAAAEPLIEVRTYMTEEDFRAVYFEQKEAMLAMTGIPEPEAVTEEEDYA